MWLAQEELGPVTVLHLHQAIARCPHAARHSPRNSECARVEQFEFGFQNPDARRTRADQPGQEGRGHSRSCSGGGRRLAAHRVRPSWFEMACDRHHNRGHARRPGGLPIPQAQLRSACHGVDRNPRSGRPHARSGPHPATAVVRDTDRMARSAPIPRRPR